LHIITNKWSQIAFEFAGKQDLKAHGLTVQSWDETLAVGRAAPAAPVAPTPEDYCTIMYTSGTTGESAGG
jgi:long-chain acyl-CoA synthetase